MAQPDRPECDGGRDTHHQRFVKICTRRKRLMICEAMSLRICTVIFLCVSRGPMFSTSFLLKRSS